MSKEKPAWAPKSYRLRKYKGFRSLDDLWGLGRGRSRGVSCLLGTLESAILWRSEHWTSRPAAEVKVCVHRNLHEALSRSVLSQSVSAEGTMGSAYLDPTNQWSTLWAHGGDRSCLKKNLKERHGVVKNRSGPRPRVSILGRGDSYGDIREKRTCFSVTTVKWFGSRSAYRSSNRRRAAILLAALSSSSRRSTTPL